MTEQVALLDLRIDASPEADAAELAELAVRRREQLLELEVEDADPVTAGQAPPGTRAGEVLQQARWPSCWPCLRSSSLRSPR